MKTDPIVRILPGIALLCMIVICVGVLLLIVRRPVLAITALPITGLLWMAVASPRKSGMDG